MKKATVLPVGMTREGVMAGAVQHEDRTVSLGIFRPVREGQPIHDLARVCEVQDRPGTPFLDATFPFAEPTEAIEAAPAPSLTAEPGGAPPVSQRESNGRKGPAKVNSAGYRDAWERIFGATGDPGEA